VIPLILLLAAAVLLYVWLSHRVRRERTRLGFKNEVIVSADDSTQGMPTLRSKRYGLVGRPDQLIRMGQMLFPVEQKPTARRICSVPRTPSTRVPISRCVSEPWSSFWTPTRFRATSRRWRCHASGQNTKLEISDALKMSSASIASRAAGSVAPEVLRVSEVRLCFQDGESLTALPRRSPKRDQD